MERQEPKEKKEFIKYFVYTNKIVLFVLIGCLLSWLLLRLAGTYDHELYRGIKYAVPISGGASGVSLFFGFLSYSLLFLFLGTCLVLTVYSAIFIRPIYLTFTWGLFWIFVIFLYMRINEFSIASIGIFGLIDGLYATLDQSTLALLKFDSHNPTLIFLIFASDLREIGSQINRGYFSELYVAIIYIVSIVILLFLARKNERKKVQYGLLIVTAICLILFLYNYDAKLQSKAGLSFLLINVCLSGFILYISLVFIYGAVRKIALNKAVSPLPIKMLLIFGTGILLYPVFLDIHMDFKNEVLKLTYVSEDNFRRTVIAKNPVKETQVVDISKKHLSIVKEDDRLIVDRSRNQNIQKTKTQFFRKPEPQRQNKTALLTTRSTINIKPLNTENKSKKKKELYAGKNLEIASADRNRVDIARVPKKNCKDITIGIKNISKCVQPGEKIQDCDECPVLVVVQSGKLQVSPVMDTIEGEEPSTTTRALALTAPIAVGKFEITVRQFRVFLTETGTKMNGACYAWDGNRMRWHKNRSFYNPGYQQSENHPAVCITWLEAQKYVAWLSSKTNKKYRLLTDSEWEYAARSGASTKFHFGTDPKLLCRYANVNDLAAHNKIPNRYIHVNCNDRFEFAAPVGTYSPNKFKLHDMYGNVREFVEDCWPLSKSNLSTGNQTNCSLHVVRDTYWYSDPKYIHVVPRNNIGKNQRSATVGLRVARQL